MSLRKNISTNTQSEKKVGYSRAVHIGNRMYISGTTAVDDNGKTFGKNVYDQVTFIFDKLKKVIEDAGFSEKDIVATTVYLVDMKQLPDFDKAFHERFSNIKPACTLVGIKEFVSPDLFIEIEYIVEKE
jgi:enamine deaminase RidA (YjgF/YER057c/UK114 family)